MDSASHNFVKNSDFLSGGGGMEKLIRDFKWEKSALGPIESWSATLKTSVNIILQTTVPMILVWEVEGWLIYNDAYSVFAGKRHPQLLGLKVEEGWPEVADFNRNMLSKVLCGEKLSYENQKLVLYRNNVPEEVWMNLNYSPVMDDRGKPVGVLAVVMETTKEVVAWEKKKKADEALKSEQQRLYNLFINAPAGIAILTGQDLVFKLANGPFLKLIGKQQSIEGQPLAHVFPELETFLLEVVRKVAFNGERFTAGELPVEFDWENTGKSYTRYLNLNYEPYYENNIANGIMAFVYDVTDLVQSRKVIEEQNTVLEMVTAGSELCDALDYLIRSIESQSRHQIIGSVLLLTHDGKQLKHCSGPGLPQEFAHTINGIDATFFIEAAENHIKEQIIVADIESWPQWKTIKELASKHKLYSCWASPIITGNTLLGIFVFYSSELKEPNNEELKIIKLATRTARLIIENNKIQEILKEREEHLRALVTATADVIYIMSADWSEMGLLDGRVFVPDQGRPMSNWEWFYANVPLEEHLRVKEGINEAVRTKSNFQMEHQIRLSDGSIGWTSSRAIPILNNKGDIEKWFGAATDITRRKLIEVALKESEERFRSLADQSPIIVFIIEPNEEATISYWSKTWLNYTGQTNEQALGRAWDGIVHPDDISLVLDIYLPAFHRKIPYTIPGIRLRRYDGEYRWHHFKANPRTLSDGTFMGFVGIGTDIHDQRLAIQELESKNAQLQRINHDLDSFIYTASHDLKAPISNIEGLMTTLKDIIDADIQNIEEQHQILAMIDKSILRFKETILDLTDISKVQKKFESDLEKVEVKNVLYDVLDTLSNIVKEARAGIEIEVQDHLHIQFSRINLKSIFYNLITNAIKYKSPERTPKVKITIVADQGYLIISVSDNGLGIKEENKPRLYTMFKRFHDHVEGTGVGLYIVKRIIDNSGGKIEVFSEVGKGTTFIVYLKQEDSEYK